ncbi:MAG: restriction endonuclease subunit S [Bacteroidota bacterium]
MSKPKMILPRGWKWEKLDDALDYVIGGDWGKDEEFEDPNYGLAYCIRGSEIKSWEEGKGRTASLRKIKLSNIEKRKLIEGDILVEISGGGPEQPVGRTVLIDKTVLSYKPEIPKICTNFLRLIRPKDYVEGKFLNLYLKLFYYSGEIVKYQGGSNNLRNLKFPDYVKINFPLPPKPIQQAIISKIEELFSELDKGIENLRIAQQQLKTYRQAVLKWAFEGRLTNEYVKEGKLPEGWKWLRFGELFSESPQNGLYKSSVEYGSGTPIIRIDGFYDGSIVDDYEYKRVRLTGEEIKKYIISVGDILINRVNSMPYLGKCGIVKHLKEKTVFESNIMKVKIDKEIALPEYFTMYLSSKKGISELRKNAKQAVNQASINQTDVSNVIVPLPLIKEQHKIVQEIESRLSVADKMEESITQSLQQSEALRQSILKKAFEGKLV